MTKVGTFPIATIPYLNLPISLVRLQNQNIDFSLLKCSTSVHLFPFTGLNNSSFQTLSKLCQD